MPPATPLAEPTPTTKQVQQRAYEEDINDNDCKHDEQVMLHRQHGRQLIIAPDSVGEPPADQDYHPEFDWNDEDTLVLRRQFAVAVYRTPDDSLVIRQQRDWNEEDDTCIVISPENVGDFVDRLTDAAGIPTVGGPKVPPPPVRRR